MPWAQGLSGLMSITGDPQGHPMKVGVAIVDIMTGAPMKAGQL
jgi:crotonobetainyl-CoA:carnitine CoA-transferase CaiB-like acyl-CoA transferase